MPWRVVDFEPVKKTPFLQIVYRRAKYYLGVVACFFSGHKYQDDREVEGFNVRTCTRCYDVRIEKED